MIIRDIAQSQMQAQERNAPGCFNDIDRLGHPEECARCKQVTDLWTGEEIPLVNGTIPNPGIPAHGCQVLRIHLHN